ncbi:MAG: MBOAT family O-acyltransferase [Flavobacteriales bacterium]|jgi:D-alanyl-lipoteichoic acid acyltransferase DltB (MBOAT superfamily)|nr:MBOAT family O-acyltransferase [Flavobacteriales bacterium]
MLFNSFAFLVFLPVVFVLYWGLFRRTLRAQNLFVLAASWFFYAWWDWRFLGLIFISSITDYIIGLRMAATENERTKSRLMWLSVGVSIGILGFFKYFNFFITEFADLLQLLGFHPHIHTLRIILPVGISFYTFQTLSYTIDIRRGQLRPTRDPVAFMAFVSFFPQLAAGPIERAQNLLKQFLARREFNWDQARDGLRQMLWGLFKKVVIADGCAPIVDHIFSLDPASTSGITLFFGAFFFAFQIYGDFSGYSDMAIGMARLFGFQLSRNFAYPYFSRSVSEFWRRWHITLSTWFRDYVYLPLGGWRNKAGRMRNIMITFAVSGLWHGANWTFISWGVLHGLFHVPMVVRGGKAAKDDPAPRDLPRILFTFLLVTVAWVFFRAADLGHAVAYCKGMVAHIAWSPGAVLLYLWRPEMAMIALLVAVEWARRTLPHPLAGLPFAPPARWVCYMALVLVLLLHVDLSTSHEFIYFQF